MLYPLCIISITECDPGFENSLIGHSLSWKDDKLQHKSANNKLFAKIWFPEFASDQDLANLTTFSGDFSMHPE